MSGVLLVTGSISPTMVLKRTMASNKLTPEQNMTAIRSEIIPGTEVRWPVVHQPLRFTAAVTRERGDNIDRGMVHYCQHTTIAIVTTDH